MFRSFRCIVVSKGSVHESIYFLCIYACVRVQAEACKERKCTSATGHRMHAICMLYAWNMLGMWLDCNPSTFPAAKKTRGRNVPQSKALQGRGFVIDGTSGEASEKALQGMLRIPVPDLAVNRLL